jgi:hypothetical protein
VPRPGRSAPDSGNQIRKNVAGSGCLAMEFRGNYASVRLSFEKQVLGYCVVDLAITRLVHGTLGPVTL